MVAKRQGGAAPVIDHLQGFTIPLVDGLVATDGVQYSSVATVGTTAVEVLSKLIDPGFGMNLKSIYATFTQRFVGQNGSFVGSMNYYWEAREERVVPDGTPSAPYAKTGAYVNLTGTYAKAVGTLATVDDTFSGNIPVASLSAAPFRVRLMAVDGNRAASFTGRVKNNSEITLLGNVIPGT